MTEVGELEENPDLGKTKITEVDYKIKTYRGEIPLSREAIDDAQYDLIGILQDDIQDQDEQTKLAIVADVLKTAKAVNASGYDGLKDILNTSMDTGQLVELLKIKLGIASNLRDKTLEKIVSSVISELPSPSFA